MGLEAGGWRLELEWGEPLPHLRLLLLLAEKEVIIYIYMYGLKIWILSVIWELGYIHKYILYMSYILYIILFSNM